MPEQVNENEVEVAIREAFDAAHEAGKEEDAIKLDMISAGATFKNVTRLFNQFMVDAGLAVSKEEKEQKLLEAVEGVDLSTEEGFDGAVATLAEAINGTEKSAAALIRAYAKKNELEVFKKSKGGNGGGKQGFAGKFYAFLVANPTCSKEQAIAFIQGTDGNEETSENVKRHQSHYLAIHAMVNQIAGVEATTEA